MQIFVFFKLFYEVYIIPINAKYYSDNIDIIPIA